MRSLAGFRREGMAVDLAPDGTDALIKARVVRYDVVVLDRDLPGTPGDDEVCRTMRGERPETGILMLTAAGVLAASKACQSLLVRPRPVGARTTTTAKS
jgi:DNA-binding response OmpR family regulator